MKLRYYILAATCAVGLSSWSQETAPVKVTPDGNNKSLTTTPGTGLQVQPLTPELSTPVVPPSLSPLSPSLTPGTTPFGIDLGSNTNYSADSIAAYSASINGSEMQVQERPQYNFRMNPYSLNYSRSGMMMLGDGSLLVGAGSFQAMPALGNVGHASLAWYKPLGDRLMVGVGMTGNKYHFDRNAWNDYGFNANASFKLSDRFSLKAWGQYYLNQRYHTMAAMPFMASSNYGASVDMKLSSLVGLELGAQRYYDPYSGRWKTVPVIAPSINVNGQPLSIDFGGLVGSLIESLVDKNRKYNEPIDPMKSYDPKQGMNMNVKTPVPPGFNPYSPVRIPDALRR
ncbi:MAG: hypothetical protein MJZ74_06505 [Muribaculaceae bacterium]|nr:hypothetical protein [Muribaculaceae bacterium]